MQHLRSLLDLTSEDVQEILELTASLKARRAEGELTEPFRGKVLALLFEKPSLRTRASFETAVAHLGGNATFQTCEDAGLNGRESTSDIARVLGSFVDVIAMRTFSQQLIEEFAEYTRCPVINALSDDRHPCQALTDAFTIQEVFGQSAGCRLTYVGDGNNVAASLVLVSALTGIQLTVATPAEYALPDSFLTDVRQRFPNAKLQTTSDPYAAAEGADVLYTDVWASMGQEQEAENRARVFRPFQVNRELLERAGADCRFMHDLPAKRGLEVTDDVMDSPQSIVFQQAENRMHLAKGLLAWIVAKSEK